MITSNQNRWIKRVRQLRLKKYRLREGAFFVEGIRPTLAALQAQAGVAQAGVEIEALIYCDDLLRSDLGRDAIQTAHDHDIPCIHIAPALFQNISQRDNPTGLGLIVKTRPATLADLPTPANALWVALIGISDPGNLGTLIRTADAAGAAGIILVGNTTDSGHPTAVKAAMGTQFTLPIAHGADESALLAWATERSLTTVATSAKTDVNFRDCNVSGNMLLILGSEKKGVSAETLSQTDHQIRIPMHGTASSLNLAVAGGILLYHFHREHHA